MHVPSPPTVSLQEPRPLHAGAPGHAVKKRTLITSQNNAGSLCSCELSIQTNKQEIIIVTKIVKFVYLVKLHHDFECNFF